MEVNNTWQSRLYKSSFWLAVLGSALLIMHLQLPYLLSPNLNYAIVRGLAWVGVVYLIWQRRKALPIDSSDSISIAIGASLITLVLVRSWFFKGYNDVLLEIMPLFSAVGLALLASGFKNLRLYGRELGLVLVSVIPFGIFLPILDRAFNFSLLAAKFAGMILYYANFDVVRKDVVLTLPSGAIEVNSGCSGLPSIAILLQMGALFAIYCRVPRLIALFLPLIGALIAFLVNGFRIMILAVLTNAQDKPAFDYWHEGTGEQVFSIISMVLFGLLCEWIWEQAHTHEDSETN